MPFDEAPYALDYMAHVFFFYPQGLKDAIEIALATTCVPDDFYYRAPNHILCDLESWIEKEYNANALPLDLDGLFNNVKIATETLEQYVLTHMRMLFGSTDVHVSHVEPMVGANMHYIVSVDF